MVTARATLAKASVAEVGEAKDDSCSIPMLFRKVATPAPNYPYATGAFSKMCLPFVALWMQVAEPSVFPHLSVFQTIRSVLHRVFFAVSLSPSISPSLSLPAAASYRRSSACFSRRGRVLGLVMKPRPSCQPTATPLGVVTLSLGSTGQTKGHYKTLVLCSMIKISIGTCCDCHFVLLCLLTPNTSCSKNCYLIC